MIAPPRRRWPASLRRQVRAHRGLYAELDVMRLSAPIIMTWLISHPDNAYTARVLDAIHTHGTTEFLALLDSGDYPLPPEDVFPIDDRRKVVVPGPWMER